MKAAIRSSRFSGRRKTPMEQNERLDYLVKRFLDDSGRYKGMEVADDPPEKRTVLRSLMNIRMPGLLDEESLRALDDLFAGAAFDAVRDEDILTSMWSKYAFNNCENLPQAVLDAGVGCFEDSAHMAWVRSMIYGETRMVAAAEGVTLPPEPKHVTSAQFPKHAIYSTLQDLRAGRKTETEMFAGTLLRLAEKHGLHVPYTEMLYHLLCAFEEKNAGLFDYTE